MSKNIEKQYLKLLKDILDNGVEKEDRTGTGTISVFGRQIRHDMSEGFPLLTTKKMYFKGIVTELLWFLRGDTNIKFLIDNDCHIWNGDAIKNYEKHNGLIDWGPFVTKEECFIEMIKTDDEFAKKWGELGPVYGAQWRSWETMGALSFGTNHYEVKTEQIDQIQNLINDLKTNPDSRRLLVSAWAVHDLPKMTLPPCHYGFQVYTRELSLFERTTLYCTKTGQKDWKERVQATIENQGEETLNKEFEKHNIPSRAISLMYNARSQDFPLGTPFNIASYALLLVIIAKMVNMVPDELITNMGDCHIYKNQIDGIKEQLTREPYPLPKLVILDDVNFTGTIDEFLNSCSISDFKIEDYQSHPTIKMPLSN